MIRAATIFLWVSAVVAIVITAGMFWLFLENHMHGEHRSAAAHFAVVMICGLIAPAVYSLWRWRLLWRLLGLCRREEPPAETFEDCVELSGPLLNVAAPG